MECLKNRFKKITRLSESHQIKFHSKKTPTCTTIYEKTGFHSNSYRIQFRPRSPQIFLGEKNKINVLLIKFYHISAAARVDSSFADKSKISSGVNKNSYKNGKTPETTYFPNGSILSFGKTPV